MSANPPDERSQLTPDDLRWAAQLVAEALAPALDRDWHVRAGDLDWDVYMTLDHVVDDMGYYAVHIATRAAGPVPFLTRSVLAGDPRVPAANLLAAVQATVAVLADVVTAVPREQRIYHAWGRSDVEGIIAMACDEILIHGDDVTRGFGLEWQPPEALCRRVLARLFPWAPVGIDIWSALRWANGRTALQGYPRLGPDWRWQAAPIAEWDGEIKKALVDA